MIPKPALNDEPVPSESARLTDAEIQIFAMLRGMRVGDSMSIEYGKYGEITWKLVRTHRGVHKVALPVSGNDV